MQGPKYTVVLGSGVPEITSATLAVLGTSGAGHSNAPGTRWFWEPNGSAACKACLLTPELPYFSGSQV